MESTEIKGSFGTSWIDEYHICLITNYLRIKNINFFTLPGKYFSMIFFEILKK